MRNLICTIAVVLLSTSRFANAKPTVEETTLSLGVAESHRLQAGDGALTWQSSDPKIAEVFSNGFVVGLKPGQAEIHVKADDGADAVCVVTVKQIEQPSIDPATLQQFPDSREFKVNGRVCFGSELCGQRASTPEEQANTITNRVINPKPVGEEKLDWPVEEGTEVYDGAGLLMGTVAVNPKIKLPSSKFNFGMSKVLHEKLCIYAFGVAIRPSDELRKQLKPADLTPDGGTSTSAWLPLDRVVDKEVLLARLGVGKVKLPRLPLEEKEYRITGGNPNQFVGEGGELSIVKTIDGPLPSHYLRRPSGTVNIIYSVPGFGLGGQGLDSFLVTDGIIFRPAKGAKIFVQPTYFPKGHPRAGQVSPQTQTFLYGAAEVTGFEPVYGWVAEGALEPMK